MACYTVDNPQHAQCLSLAILKSLFNRILDYSIQHLEDFIIGFISNVKEYLHCSRSSSIVRIAESSKYPPSQNGGKGKPPPILAWKLAATLWVMNEIPFPHMKEGVLEERRLLKKEMRGRDRNTRSVQSGSLPPHLFDPSHSPDLEELGASEEDHPPFLRGFG
ncbi:hypothetical protein NE237_003520 [Protea cynaroides]|uniref:Uncharacterized protein n=1 Tax=Protea cynaroides TaxID=273540 RepID=A0A9Q0KH83_9MAGN|nr:hypothetical protein NE237_003520 [Protea cynaroides]